jgi:hypothetical protein
VDRKVFATIGFFDFAFGISVVFSNCCPATVSDSETVFLCPLSSSASPVADSYFITQTLPLPPVDANTLPQPWLLLPAPQPTLVVGFSVIGSGK